MSAYHHTQKGPWSYLLYAIGAAELVAAWFLRQPPGLSLTLTASGLLLVVLGACFMQLTVADAGPALLVQFGPLPLFRKRMPYADIRSVERGRTTLLDGWGIHLSARGGWVWNIWGRDCVVVRHRGTTRIGTDDAPALVAFLQSRMPAGEASPKSGQAP